MLGLAAEPEDQYAAYSQLRDPRMVYGRSISPGGGDVGSGQRWPVPRPARGLTRPRHLRQRASGLPRRGPQRRSLRARVGWHVCRWRPCGQRTVPIPPDYRRRLSHRPSRAAPVVCWDYHDITPSPGRSYRRRLLFRGLGPRGNHHGQPGPPKPSDRTPSRYQSETRRPNWAGARAGSRGWVVTDMGWRPPTTWPWRSTSRRATPQSGHPASRASPDGPGPWRGWRCRPGGAHAAD